MKELRGKWVLITGAASGIGQSVAQEFARRGSNVVIADLDEDGMARTRDEVIALGVKSVSIKADMGDPAQVESLARRALEETETGRVDVLVNNAGIFMMTPTPSMTVEEWERFFAVNLRGPILLTHHLLPAMIARGAGHVVNVASMAGLIAGPGMSAYNATKFGLVGYSKSLRAELARQGIGVTVICPGIVNTPIINTAEIRTYDIGDRDIAGYLMIPAERAAREIADAVVKNKPLHIPASLIWKPSYLLSRLFPVWYGALVGKVFDTFITKKEPNG